MGSTDEPFLREFYRALVDRPLEPDDPQYVPIYSDPTPGEVDPVQRLARGMRWTPLESAQLFSGFRGTGKSTELRRLRHLLKDQGEKVVLCDMQRYLNLSTPVDISDFLISAAGALSDALAEDPDLLGQDLAHRGYFQRAVDFLTRTNIDLGNLHVTSKVEDASENLRMGLQQDPTFRERLQAHLKGHLGALAQDVREFMADCVKAIRHKHGEQTNLVVLFDSIEQIRGSSVNDADVFASVETLFVGHADKLKFQGMHMVYTVPPWLKVRSPGIGRLYDSSYLLPCIKVRQRSGETFEPGLTVLRRIIEQRGDWQRLFAQPADLDYVLLETGGYLRDLLRVLQGISMRAADHESMPVDRQGVEQELSRVRNDYLPIALADAGWLHRVARSHEAELPTHAQLRDLSRYFDTHLLLCYRNGDEWYDLHPLIRKTVERLARQVPSEPTAP